MIKALKHKFRPRIKARIRKNKQILNQNVKNLFDITDRSYVLGEQSIIAEGTARELLKSSKAIKYYFGSQFS